MTDTDIITQQEEVLRRSAEGLAAVQPVQVHEAPDALDAYRRREQEIRKAEYDARRKLRELRERIDSAQAEDIAAYAHAVVQAQSPPAATARKMREQMKDLTGRVLPGFDQALVLLADEIRNAISEPGSDEAQMLAQNTPRWKPVPRLDDPNAILPEPHGERRPDNITDWVEHQHRLVVQGKQRREDEAYRKARKQEVANALSDAQDAWYNAQLRQWESEPHGPMAEFHVRRSDFDRRRWLKINDPNDEYGYVQPGAQIGIKGSARAVRAMHAPPGRDTAPDTSPASTEA